MVDRAPEEFAQNWMTACEVWVLRRVYYGLAADLAQLGLYETPNEVSKILKVVLSPFQPICDPPPLSMPDYPANAERAEGVLSDRKSWVENRIPTPIRSVTWPKHQRVSDRFLQYILLDPVFNQHRARSRTRISRALITGSLDLASGRIDSDLELSFCRFDARPDLSGLEITGYLRMHGSYFPEGMLADALAVKRAVIIDQGAVFEDELTLRAAAIDGALACSGSTFKAGVSGFTVNADRARVSGGIFFNSGAYSFGEFRCVDVVTSRDISFRDGVLLAGESGCALRADRAKVDGSLFIRGNAAVDGDLSLGRATIGKDVQLWGAAINGKIDLSASQIKGELLLDETSSSNGARTGPYWGQAAHLNLRNSSIGALHGSRDAWRRVIPGKRWKLLRWLKSGSRFEKAPTDYLPKNIDGLCVERLAGGLGGESLDSMRVADLRNWLSCGVTHNRSDQKFSPAPFLSISKALKDAGLDAANRSILIELEKKRTQALLRSRKTFFSGSARYFWVGPVTGYGYRSSRGALYLLGLILIFAGIGLFVEYIMLGRDLQASSWRDALSWLGFSIETSIPLVDLDPVSDTFLEDRFGVTESWLHGGKSYEDLPWGVRGLFMLQRFIGLAILATFVAGLTGWAERRGEG